MRFSADFHVHSRFSRSTSPNLDLENLYIGAQLKGLTVIGTGDFTHPQWFLEIKEKLVEAEDGLFQLKANIASICDKAVPPACRSKVRFILTSEISNIYKKKDKTRKNHNLVFVPDMQKAARINQTLAAIGNIHADGRPILGLDAKNLLEILLKTSEKNILIPAHIWTPWFSVLGSKSGFNSIEECFEDLSKYIFAVETGLSSDPAMNRRVSCLDKYALISNSDAHSPLNLGREANLFNTDLSYDHIFSAIKNRNYEEFSGTYEFYPEQGKYHLDGHRKCNIRLSPKESIQNKGICPQCGKPLTVGVLYRVEELADRPRALIPDKKTPFYNAVPLTDILSEILNVGPQSKRVQTFYHTLLYNFGSEFKILHDTPIEKLKQSGQPQVAEAISRMRRGELFIEPGYDGEFGKIHIFYPGEKEAWMGQKTLFEPQQRANFPKNGIRQQKNTKDFEEGSQTASLKTGDETHIKDVNPEQLQAIQAENRALLIVAGPGAGKTLTLTLRIAHLMTNQNVSSEKILAVTFTNKAAREMKARIQGMNAVISEMPQITTFHGLCYKILSELGSCRFDGTACSPAYTIIDESEQLFFFNMAVDLFKSQGGKLSANTAILMEQIRLAKQQLMEPADMKAAVGSSTDGGMDSLTIEAVYAAYQRLLSHQCLYDFEDLILKTVKRLESDPAAQKTYQGRYPYIFVDEFQDINLGQHRLLQLLSGPATRICVIGDPDQSIYGFRGSDVKYFNGFISDFDDNRVIRLRRNYRSTRTIVHAAQQVMARQIEDPKEGAGQTAYLTGNDFQSKNYSEIEGVNTIPIITAPSDRAEAVAVGKTIESMIGGSGFHFNDFGTQEAQSAAAEKERSFSDFAVLYRTGIQGKIFADVFSAAGIPHQVVQRDRVYAAGKISVLVSLLRILAGAGSFMDMARLTDILSAGVSGKSMKIFGKWSFENKMNLPESLKNARRFPIPGMSKSGQNRLTRLIDHLDRLHQETEGMTVRDTIQHIVRQTRLVADVQKDEQSNLAFRSLLELSEAYGRQLLGFINAVALQTDTDLYLPRSEKVALMTMHAAKGLEFPVVFICGCEDGYIPLRRVGLASADIAEERRLFYVAMTRAKERLIFTCARQRRIYGKKEMRRLSPFIQQIDSKMIDFQESFCQKPKSPRQLKLF